MAKSFIFNSKLYRAHPDKARIHAALENPVNAELVQQLHEYLDEEYQPLAIPQEEFEKVVDVPEEPEGKNSSAPSSPPRPSGRSSGYVPSGGLGDITFSEPEGSDEPSADESDVPDADVEPEDEPEVEPEVDSATQRRGHYVKASSEIGLDSLKGLLDLNNDTTGVYRLGIVDNELWIYYNDNINLNNVMTPAIELLLASGYSQLSFNRLARTNNAIVFEILPTASESQYGVEDNDVNE